MRVYFEKPRTTTGWKGLINDPHLDDSGDVNTGLRVSRELLLHILDVGLPIGVEWLDPITPQYIADTVSWGAIGARTTESQVHRQLASGLSMPVGFKNRTDGNLGVAVDALRAAGAQHSFAGVDLSGTSAILHTSGNPDCHIILRGGRDATNFDAASIDGTLERLRAVDLPERVIVDASHDNSGKDHERQPGVAERDRRAGRGRQRRDRRRHARVLPRGGPPGPRRQAHLRPVDHRQVHELGDDDRRPPRPRAGRSQARRRLSRATRPTRGGVARRLIRSRSLLLLSNSDRKSEEGAPPCTSQPLPRSIPVSSTGRRPRSPSAGSRRSAMPSASTRTGPVMNLPRERRHDIALRRRVRRIGESIDLGGGI